MLLRAGFINVFGRSLLSDKGWYHSRVFRVRFPIAESIEISICSSDADASGRDFGAAALVKII
jgi:hypothetical protein